MKVWVTTHRQASVVLLLCMSNTNCGFLITFTQKLRGRQSLFQVWRTSASWIWCWSAQSSRESNMYLMASGRAKSLCAEDGLEEVVHELLQRALGGQRPRQVDLANHLATAVALALVQVATVLDQVPQLGALSRSGVIMGVCERQLSGQLAVRGMLSYLVGDLVKVEESEIL